MPKTRKQPKISSQLFTKMVENTVGAKVHLDFAANKEGALKKGHLDYAKAYLKDLSQSVERMRADIGTAISRLPQMSPTGTVHARPKTKK